MRKNYSLPVLLFFSYLTLTGVFARFACAAEDSDSPTSSSIPPSVGEAIAESAEKNDKHSYLSLTHENDLLAGSGDKFYTSGIQATYFNIDSKPPSIVRKLVDDWGGFDISSATLTSFTLGQKIFTPSNIRISTPQPNERPWAGWLYGTIGLANVYDHHADQFGLTLGMVGPASLVEQSQKFIHKHLSDSPEPQGWNNQIHTEPGLILSWDRRWPVWVNAEWQGYRVLFEPNISLAAGNIYTYGGAGITMTFGPDQGAVQDTPPRLTPSLPGTGYFDVTDRGWNWYMFTGLNTRLVARDIFLDGNTFRDSAHIDKKNVVADANAGLALTLGNTRIAYTLVYRTKEFEGQDDPSIFGSISLTQRF